MLEGLLLPVILSLLGGGGLVGFLTYKIAKRKAPAEIDSIVVQSAETAAVTLTKSLAAETARADANARDRDRLAAEVTRKDARIEALEGTVTQLYATIDGLRATVDRVNAEVQSLRRGE